eukprot:4318277-Amphidinium_carterae.1
MSRQVDPVPAEVEHCVLGPQTIQTPQSRNIFLICYRSAKLHSQGTIGAANVDAYFCLACHLGAFSPNSVQGARSSILLDCHLAALFTESFNPAPACQVSH